MSDWRIRRKTQACSKCEREFEEEEVHFSLLSLGEELLERRDLCAGCFEGREEDAGELVFWRTRRAPEEKKRGLQVDFDTLETLFLALEGREEELLREIRYLLCLLLMRKRRVKLVRVLRRNDGEVMVTRRPRRTEELEVHVFDLTPERSKELQVQLERIFEGTELDDLLRQPLPTPEAADEPENAPEGAGKTDQVTAVGSGEDPATSET